MGMYDVTWHFRGDQNAVDNMDFATWAGINSSNRTITGIGEATTDPTASVDRSSAKGRDLYRGYTNSGAEALLALKAKEHADANGVPIDRAADHVVSSNTGADKLAGDFDVAAIIKRARTVDASSRIGGPSDTRGVLDRLTVSDRIGDRIGDATSVDRARDR
jgi:hypothetical protein